MTYKILFIDEEKSAHAKFTRNFLNKNRDRFVGFTLFPTASLVDMLQLIVESKPDAVLTDYSLNEYKNDLASVYDVEYHGGDVAKGIHAMWQGFPVFITTSLGDDAANDGADVKIIYEKYRSFNDGQNDTTELSEDKQHLSFADKLYYEVKGYKKIFDDATNEFDLLIAKQNDSDIVLSLQEEERLIELDDFFEKSLDKKSKLPKHLKGTTNTSKLEQLIALTEKLIKNKND